jgi:hypothetical protein
MVWNKAGDVVNTFYKSYLYKTMYRDVSDFLRRNVKDMDFDRESMLRRVGLTSYRPTRSAFGGMGLFVLGAVAGGIAGLLLAPKPGTEIRTEVADRARTLMQRPTTLQQDMPVRA